MLGGSCQLTTSVLISALESHLPSFLTPLRTSRRRAEASIEVVLIWPGDKGMVLLVGEWFGALLDVEEKDERGFFSDPRQMVTCRFRNELGIKELRTRSVRFVLCAQTL